MMRARTLILFILFALTLSPSAGNAQTAQQIRTMLDATTKSWIAFREYNGAQLIYFTQFVTMKCALKEVRFSLNSPSLEHTFELPKCNWEAPFNVDAKKLPYISMALGTAKSISVQVTYSDGSKSRIYTYRPCNVDPGTSCAKLIE